MAQQTLAHQISQASGILIRLEQDMGKAKNDLHVAIRNLTVGSVVLLIGLIALIAYFLLNSQCVAAIAAIGLFIGGVMAILALVKIRGAHHSIDTNTGKIANARAELDGLKAQLPAAE
jgi:hypothetical protein